MRLATSRRPSPRTRRLASFLGCERITWGNSGLDDEEEVKMVAFEAFFFGLEISPEGAAGRPIGVGGREIDLVEGIELIVRLKI